MIDAWMQSAKSPVYPQINDSREIKPKDIVALTREHVAVEP